MLSAAPKPFSSQVHPLRNTHTKKSVCANTVHLYEISFHLSGGDQNEYITYWANSDVQTIIQSKLVNVTVGGTSAGLAILGNWVYTAADGTVYSDEALAVS